MKTNDLREKFLVVLTCLRSIPGLLHIFYLRDIKGRFRGHNILDSGPRRCLEYRLFPYFHDSDEFQNILLVGVAPCTAHYGEYFKRKRSVHSIDIDAKRADFGVAGQHIIDSIENIDKYFNEGYFDCVLMNGVYGWGLDNERSLTSALGAVKKVLRRGGVFLFGWDKVPKYDPIDLDSKPSFRDFAKCEISGASRIEMDNKHHHIFDFYRKP